MLQSQNTNTLQQHSEILHCVSISAVRLPACYETYCKLIAELSGPLTYIHSIHFEPFSRSSPVPYPQSRSLWFGGNSFSRSIYSTPSPKQPQNVQFSNSDMPVFEIASCPRPFSRWRTTRGSRANLPPSPSLFVHPRRARISSITEIPDTRDYGGCGFFVSSWRTNAPL